MQQCKVEPLILAEKESSNQFWKVQVALWGTVILWASAYVFIRIGLQSFHPGSLSFFRYVVASLTMLILYARLKRKNRLSLSQILQLIFLGALGIGFYDLLLNYGERTVPAGIAAFLVGIRPIISIVLAMILLKEKVVPKYWLGVAVSIIGMLMIALGESDVTGFDYGVIYIIGAALLGSYYIVGQKPLLLKIHPLEAAFWAILGGALVMIVFSPLLIDDLHHASGASIFAAIYLGIFPGAIGYTIWGYALTYTPASKAALYLYALPIFATLLGFVMLSEVPILLSFLGGLIALLGAIIGNYFYLHSKRITKPTTNLINQNQNIADQYPELLYNNNNRNNKNSLF